jgi:excisionase family DNA binding protein
MPEKPESTNDEFLTPRQVAVLLKIAPVTVRHWALDGKLKFVTTPGGHRRFSYSDIEQFARVRGIHLATEDVGPIRVLIVDDNRAFADYLKEVLVKAEVDVIVDIAHDGFEVGQQVFLFKPDVILLDLMIPGLDGFETCRRIKNNMATQHIRVIAMSGFPSEENIKRIMEVGAERCLAKPIRAPTLLQAIGIDVEPPSTKELQLPTSDNSA